MVIIMGGIYFYAQYNPEEHQFFPKCPVFVLTGYRCPGCGSQRAFYHLFHGNIMMALRNNPFIIAVILYVLSGVYLEYVANKSNPRTIRLREILFGNRVLLALALIIILFTILRNL